MTTIREDAGSGGMRARTILEGEGCSRFLADAKLEEKGSTEVVVRPSERAAVARMERHATIGGGKQP
jgi:hypothetical protein